MIYEKLFELQQKAKATKDKKNSFGNYTYRSAEGIIEDIKPVLKATKTAIILTDDIKEIGGRIYVEATATLLDMEKGESISTKALAREAEMKKGMDEAQITGAASSYARKYALSGLLLLDDNKDADSDEYQSRQQATAPASAPAKTAPAKKQAQQEMCVCAKCQNLIRDTAKYPARQIIEESRKRFNGITYCYNCMREVNEEQKKAQAELPFPLEVN